MFEPHGHPMFEPYGQIASEARGSLHGRVLAHRPEPFSVIENNYATLLCACRPRLLPILHSGS